MSRSVLGKIYGGLGPYTWKTNNVFLSPYKNYTTVLSCLSKKYMSTLKTNQSNIIPQKNVYIHYNDKLKQDIKISHLPRSLPSINHYFNVLDMTKFAIKYVLSYRFFFIYMARTTFQAVRPLMAFCVFGELMKLILATMTSGVFAFFFSFVLAFEVLYFFLQLAKENYFNPNGLKKNKSSNNNSNSCNSYYG
ncbi:conserved protein, unknown function [Hepatocystis sp. ex Piliocolobus tephrosceles]|nr:conserved protein, unknown function [Hepatocystis sp. ex Piliocolobus tephrosceles]VWU51982.1 conserved protein, unknown function [Hepatocystis sp. ex Piliocolobus tephrosceles]